ncbi:MAG: tetratricopeptide repeat protein [Chthoniobacterales bacterium]|nr:tetratricopeptide repeat protein [Chthoniobacterales bacterium]
MRLVLLFLFCALLTTAAPANDRPIAASEQREQLRHEKFLQEHPNSAAAHISYADFLSEHNNLRAAIAHWRTAQQLDPDNAAIANALGGAYLRMGKAAASAAEFARASGLDRNNAAYHFNLANVEFMLRHDLTAAWKMEMPGVLRRALKEFREASRLSPNDMEYARAYAETFYGIPDANWAEAEAAWKHVLSLSPQSDFVYLHLARVSLKRGDAEGARQFLNKIVDVRHDGLKRKLQAQADRL